MSLSLFCLFVCLFAYLFVCLARGGGGGGSYNKNSKDIPSYVLLPQNAILGLIQVNTTSLLYFLYLQNSECVIWGRSNPSQCYQTFFGFFGMCFYNLFVIIGSQWDYSFPANCIITG